MQKQDIINQITDSLSENIILLTSTRNIMQTDADTVLWIRDEIQSRLLRISENIAELRNTLRAIEEEE